MTPRPIRHSDVVLIAWRLAELESANLRSPELEPVHFFLALLKVVELDIAGILAESTLLSTVRIKQELGFIEKLASIFESLGLETTQTRRRLRRSVPAGADSEGSVKHHRRSTAAREVFQTAEQDAAARDADLVEPTDVLAGIAAVSCPWVMGALDQSGVTESDLLSALGKIPEGDAVGLSEVPDGGPIEETKRPIKAVNKRNKGSDIASRLGRDLTSLAREERLSPVIGRKGEMRALIQTLLRSRKNNAILIGESGVGKTGVVEGLAQRIAAGKVPPEFVGKRIVELSMGSLVAGTNLRGDMEARLQALIAEAKGDPDLILFIDEIHLLVGAGQGSGSMDAANLLKPALARGEMRVIGATTTHEFRKFIEVDAALARRFEVIEVLEPDRTETLAILQGLRANIQSHHGVKIEDEALEAAVDLTVRYLPVHRLPDKAIDVLDQACAQARMRSLSGDLRAQFKDGLSIKRNDVAAAVAYRCKVPVGDLTQDETARLLNFESDLELRVKGQRRAITAVSEAIRWAHSGLKEAGHPIGVFLFAGPSGTGKTELAKALTACLFGDENHLIRIDMSEFMEEHSVSKLIGAPPGFIGHEQGGQLTERVRSRPHSVVLLDEVEKAHPKVLDIFLQVFDNGFLTDSHGMRCDFRNSIIIMTSNLGARKPNGTLGFGSNGESNLDNGSLEKDVGEAVAKTFRSEFTNRITEIVAFHSLSREAVRKILDLIVERMNGRLRAKGLRLLLSEDAAEWLIKRGFNEEFGARHLERAVEQSIAKPLSNLILSGNANPGSMIRVEVRNHTVELDVSKFEI